MIPRKYFWFSKFAFPVLFQTYIFVLMCSLDAAANMRGAPLGIIEVRPSEQSGRGWQATGSCGRGYTLFSAGSCTATVLQETLGGSSQLSLLCLLSVACRQGQMFPGGSLDRFCTPGKIKINVDNLFINLSLTQSPTLINVVHGYTSRYIALRFFAHTNTSMDKNILKH